MVSTPEGGPALARYIDHTLLKPESTAAQIIELCAEAREHEFRTVCVNSRYVPLAARELDDPDQAELASCLRADAARMDRGERPPWPAWQHDRWVRLTSR